MQLSTGRRGRRSTLDRCRAIVTPLFVLALGACAGDDLVSPEATRDVALAVSGTELSTTEIRSLHAEGQCMTIGSGNRVVLAACADAPTQQFVVQRTGEIRYGSLCLTPVTRGGSQGDVVHVTSCDGSDDQQWSVTDQNEIRGIGDRCLTLWGALVAAGTPVVQWTCHGKSHTKWSLTLSTPVSDPSDPIETPPAASSIASLHAEGQCVAVRSDGILAIADCAVAESQRYVFAESGEILAGELCVTPLTRGGKEGDGVRVTACDGSADQQWTVTAANEIRGIGDRCLTLWGARTAPGTTLVQWRCHGGSHTKWKVTAVTGDAPDDTPDDPEDPEDPVPTPSPTGGFHVTPQGRSTAQGTLADPWDLASALTNTATVGPGDTIWVHGGTYDGNFAVRVAGSPSQPVVIRAVPGQRAVIRRTTGGVAATVSMESPYVWLWGLEVDGAAVPCATGVNLGVSGSTSIPGVKLINLYVHDSGVNGIGAWSQAPDAEIYGSVLHRNGHDACSPEGSGRLGYGHGIYVQNTTGTKRIEDNFILDTFGYGMHAYTQEGALRNISIIGNAFARNRGGQEVHVGGANLTDPVVRENMIWGTGAVLRVGDLYAPAVNPVVEDNYLVLDGWRWPVFAPLNADNLRFNRNTLIRLRPTAAGTIQQQGRFSAASWGQNKYHGDPATGEFQWLDPAVNLTMTWAQFRQKFSTLTSSDSFSGLPTQSVVFVRPNRYERGRANVVVFNWSGASSVTASLPVAPSNGYNLYDATNFGGGPVASGSGSTVSIPMGGKTFGTFVVIPR